MMNRKGFTIVELLIVIVVIAILAAITIVAYNGIQNRAKQSAAQSRLTQANKKILAYAVQNTDTYPESLAQAEIENSDNGLQYTVNNSANPKTYGLTSTNGNFSYYVTSTNSKPIAGGYQGHGQNGVAAITNYVTNTSIETDLAQIQNIGNVSGRSLDRVAVNDAVSGNYVVRLTSNSSGQLGGYGAMTLANVPPGVYVASLWMRANTAGVVVNPYLEGTASKSNWSDTGNGTLPVNTWRRLVRTFTVTTAGTVKVGFLTGSTIVGSYVDMDGFMLTAGSDVYNFADGNTTNWAWTGAENASTSVGPPLL